MTKKRLLALLLTLLLCAIAVPVLAEEEVPTIGIAISDAINVEDFETNTMTLMLEEACGVDLTFDVYPSTDYNSKINMMISAGGSELPDVVFVDPSDAELLSWIESGVLLPITEYCYDETLAPNLHDAMERTGVDILQQITMYDGEIYGIPKFNQTYNSEYYEKAWYNMEWLEQLEAKHIFSHVEWHMHAYVVLVEETTAPKENILFTEAQKAVENYAVPSAFSAYWNAIKMEIKE